MNEKMYDGSVPRQESARAIMKLQEKYLEENKAYMKDGFCSYFRKTTPKTRSTKQEIDNLVSHVLRGDYKDSFPPHQMSFVRRNATANNVMPPKSKGGLEKLGHLHGTNCSESSNKQVNNATQNITQLGQQLGKAKVKLCIQDHNCKNDGENSCSTLISCLCVRFIFLMPLELAELQLQPSRMPRPSNRRISSVEMTCFLQALTWMQQFRI
jgi:hypothetical protein